MAPDESVAQEATLVARASSGDRDAMAELYNRHFDGVYDFVRRMMRDADEAADVVQDVFLKAMTAVSSLKKGERFCSWLFSIAHNMALNRLEKQKRVTRPPAREEEQESLIYQQIDPDRLADPQAALVDQETATLVWEAAAGLDRRQYALLDLHVRQGLDSAEIAQVMGVSKGNAYTMVSRLKSAVEESITAYLMMRRGRKECPVLNDILAEQEIEGMTPEVRRLVNRHVSECPTCERTKKRIVSPVAILSAFAAIPPPLGLKEAIFQGISGASGGQPPGDGGSGAASTREGSLAGRESPVERLARAGREAVGSLPRSRLALLLTGGAIGISGALIVGLLALFGAFSGDGEPEVLGVAAMPSPSAAASAIGTPPGTAEATQEATATPTPTATPTLTAASSWSQPPTGPTTEPTPAAADEIAGPAPTPALTATPVPTPTPTPTPTPPPPPPDTTGPQISSLSADSGDIWENVSVLTWCTPTTSTVTAQVTDPSGVASVEIAWSVGSVSDSGPMILLDSTAGAVVGPFDENTITASQAQVTITVTATDTLGNESEQQTNVTLHNCTLL